MENRKLSIISFTKKGMQLSERVRDSLIQTSLSDVTWEKNKKFLSKEDILLFTKCSALAEERQYQEYFVTETLNDWTKRQLEEKQGLLFIGACGIAVRAIAPFLTDKLHDSPVLVMDEAGQFIIPILSGHVGGANEIAEWIARNIGAVPVITTATDVNHTFSVDVFARKNQLSIEPKEGIAKVSAKLLEQGCVTMSIEPGHFMSDTLDSAMVQKQAGIQMLPYPPQITADILITTQDWQEEKALLFLKPKEYVIGMGCKKGKEISEIEQFVTKVLEENQIRPSQVAMLASIDKKREEPAFVELSRRWNLPFMTYSASELAAIEGDFHASAFVKQTVGVDNVCERAALKGAGAGAKLVYEKHQQEGMTIAIAKRKWRITFE